MRNQRGFAIPAMIWGYAAVGLILLAMAGTIAVQTSRLATCKAEAALFVAKIQAEGDKAKREKQDQEMRDKLNLEKANVEKADLYSKLAILDRKLRDERARRSTVPPASPSSKRPDLAAFDRTELNRAMEYLDGRGADIVRKGSEATVDLNVAKQWNIDRESNEH